MGVLFQYFYHFAWVAVRQHVIGNIFGYDASCTNGHIASYGYSRKNYGIPAHPNIIANSHRLGIGEIAVFVLVLNNSF